MVRHSVGSTLTFLQELLDSETFFTSILDKAGEVFTALKDTKIITLPEDNAVHQYKDNVNIYSYVIKH